MPSGIGHRIARPPAPVSPGLDDLESGDADQKRPAGRPGRTWGRRALGGAMARWRGSRLRWAIAGLLVVVLVAVAIVAWPLVQRYIGAAPPAQFYEKVELDPALTGDYPHVLG